MQRPPSKTAKKQKHRRPGTAFPPPFQGSRSTGDVVRFTITSGILYASSPGIDRGNMLNLWNVVAVANVSAYRVFQSVKLRKIEMWSPVSAGSTSADLGVEWTSEFGPAKVVAATTEGLAKPGHLVTKPPKMSTGGFWSMAGTNEADVLFYIWGPAGTVVDLHITGVLVADNSANLTSVAPGLGTAAGSVAIMRFGASWSPSPRQSD
jgi:hypothetical protein